MSPSSIHAAPKGDPPGYLQKRGVSQHWKLLATGKHEQPPTTEPDWTRASPRLILFYRIVNREKIGTNLAGISF